MAEHRPSFRTVEGSVNVTITEIQTNNTVLIIGAIDDVVQDTLTTIATLPSNGIKYITKIMCTGEDNARWDVYVNNVRQFTQRTTDRNVDFDFPTPLKIFATSIVDVKATCHGSGTTSDFQATIFGYQAIADITPPSANTTLVAS